MKKITITYRVDTFPKTTVKNGEIMGDVGVEGIILEGDTLVVSDGYHTFDELYEHRFALFIALCKAKNEDLVRRVNDSGYESPVWRSRKHFDGSSFENMFVMGIGKEEGKQITYHLPLHMWDVTDFAETMDYAPLFDGHTPDDVIKRLINL